MTDQDMQQRLARVATLTAGLIATRPRPLDLGRDMRPLATQYIEQAEAIDDEIRQRARHQYGREPHQT